MQKDLAGLEGHSMDVGNLKMHVCNAIAEGGLQLLRAGSLVFTWLVIL